MLVKCTEDGATQGRQSQQKSASFCVFFLEVDIDLKVTYKLHKVIIHFQSCNLGYETT